jgi:2-keto-4-pentenoate hydratase/2-oxohepta-3-ene-1,7-dioic acid hydratase in catechol pathway
MRAAVNGRPYSEGSLADLYWSFEEMVAYAARDARVVPGDVIGSGTCGSGCILELSLVHGHETFPWLQRGDRVELTVDELGTLVNTIA